MGATAPMEFGQARIGMPLIQVQMVAGRTSEQKAALIRELAQATMRAIGAPEASIRVILNEVPAEHWGIGTVSKAEKDRSGG
jgi:4-oxalocrotonate tautomerase